MSMTIRTTGYYYLHENGEVIFKRQDDPSDLRESDFVRHFWRFDSHDRRTAWTIVVEALAMGANHDRITELAVLWECNDKDADVYADVVGCVFTRDGNAWCATLPDFVNLQESPAGFGKTKLEAMASLAVDLGVRPSKMWGATFASLMKKETEPKVGEK